MISQVKQITTINNTDYTFDGSYIEMGVGDVLTAVLDGDLEGEAHVGVIFCNTSQCYPINEELNIDIPKVINAIISFTNPNSIDAVIHQLNIAKQILKDKLEDAYVEQ